MPTLTQISILESLALTALQKVLTTTDNPHIIVRAANAILRYCKSSPSQRKGPGMGNMNAEIIKGPTPTSPSQREGAGGRVMSPTPIKISKPAPSVFVRPCSQPMPEQTSTSRLSEPPPLTKLSNLQRAPPDNVDHAIIIISPQ